MHLLIRDICKAYPNGVQALRNVSLTIPVGMTGLLGPSGAGKSTLMRLLATVQEADAGSARLGELDVLHDKDEVRRAVGYLPQESFVYPQVSAVDLLAHFALLRGFTRHCERREVVEGLLRQVGVWEERTQKLGGFAEGKRQRFRVAVALLGNPKLLIVDEPSAGLEPCERTSFLELLGEISEKIIVIISTRSVEDVSGLCTRLAIIDRGEILLEGAPLRTMAELRDVYASTVAAGGALADRRGSSPGA